MSAEAEAIVTTAAADKEPGKKAEECVVADTTPGDKAATPDAPVNKEQDLAEKILKAKELFSQGSRNFLVKSYDEAADELSQVCQIYEEVYGELADELGQPLLLYAKSLIAMALDENKVIDVPDEAADDDEDVEDDDDEEDNADDEANGEKNAKANGSDTNGKKLEGIKESAADEADSTGDTEKSKTEEAGGSSKPPTGVEEVSSSNGNAAAASADDERPSTSNGEASTGNGAATSMDVDQVDDDNEEVEGVSGSLQLAWEILEAAAKIFSRQGLSGMPYLADVQTELANIEFENGIFDAANEDYEKALKIHGELPTKNRRALAELHYKIGLTYLMQQLNKEGAASLRNSSVLIEEEIAEINAKENPTEREKNNVLDLEETRQEILVKIQEIEETQAQTIAEVRAALDSYIKPMSSSNGGDAAASSSSAAAAAKAAANGAATSSSSSTASAASSSAISSSSAKPTDITHLIKRKKPEEPSSEAEAASSPAKRAAL